MRDSLREEDTPREYREIDRKLNTTPHTPHTPHNEKREATQIRLRKSIHKAVSEYCHDARMGIGQFYEEAAILFIDVNPPPMRNPVILEKLERRDNSPRDRMLSMICKKELEEIIPALKTLSDNHREIPKRLLEKLTKTFDKCYKITTPSEELNLLILEALEYVE